MGVHVGHLAQVPHLEGPVLRHSVELIVFLIKSDPCDRVAVAEEALNLRLVVDVPNPHYSILTTRYQVLAVWRYSGAEYFIVVTIVRSVKLFASEEEL